MKVLSCKTRFQGKLFQVSVDEVVEPGGIRAKREVVHHGSSVVILPCLVVIDVKAGHALPRPAPLDEIKKEPLLSGFDLVRLPRLSLMPVSESQWKTLMKLAGVK